MSDSNEKTVLKIIAKQLFLQGLLQESQVHDKEVIKKIFLKSMEDAGGLYIVTDHREDLLKHANYFHEIGSGDMSIVIYAMYFEHAINSIIAQTLAEDGIKNSTKNEVLRNASLAAKLSWILELLYLPAFKEEHRKFILSLAEERNSFVHYKFNPVKSDIDSNTKINALLEKVKKTVRYMKSYSARVEYKGKKHAINSGVSKI